MLDISGPQLRAARTLLGATIPTTAIAADLAPSTVRKLESQPETAQFRTMRKLVGYLESLGIRFVDGGVVLQTTKPTV
jgi:hypothetical protein